jgi:hypothetical protein
MVLDGCALLSDDEVWIDPATLLAHPSPRSLLLKESAWELFPEYRRKFVPSGEDECRSWWLSADDLRPGCRATAAPICGVIFVIPRSAQRAFLERVGQTEALGRILLEAMNFPEVGDAGLSALVKVVRTASLFRLQNGELQESVQLVARCFQ